MNITRHLITAAAIGGIVAGICIALDASQTVTLILSGSVFALIAVPADRGKGDE